jgi:cytoskeletal protein CcmA (bactofilin family)
MIGMTVKIKGDINSEENLVIEGQVDGTITLNSHELTVGQSGRVNADITAKTIKIDGQVSGDLVGKEKIIISKTGNVRGNLTAPVVVLEEGGKFKGGIDMGNTDTGSNAELPIADFANAARTLRTSGDSGKGDGSKGDSAPAASNHG